jgi:hypothetical protein
MVAEVLEATARTIYTKGALESPRPQAMDGDPVAEVLEDTARTISTKGAFESLRPQAMDGDPVAEVLEATAKHSLQKGPSRAPGPELQVKIRWLRFSKPPLDTLDKRGLRERQAPSNTQRSGG